MRRSITCLIAIWAFSALLTLSLPASHAMSVAGTYDLTNGLTGYFTTDGASLTDWYFTDPNNRTWTPLVSAPSLTANSNSYKLPLPMLGY